MVAKSIGWISLWLASVVYLAHFAITWSVKPGSPLSAIPAIPAKEGVVGVMLVHPDCPCTAASLKLLATALSETGSHPKLSLLVTGEGADSPNSVLARKVPWAVVQQVSAEDAKRKYGFATSGHILLWNQGHLVFSGGITDGRGDEQEGAAYKEFAKALQGEKREIDLPTFGCQTLEVQTP